MSHWELSGEFLLCWSLLELEMFSVICNSSLLLITSLCWCGCCRPQVPPQFPSLTPESGRVVQASYDPSISGGSTFLDLSSAVKATSPLSCSLAFHHFMLLSRDLAICPPSSLTHCSLGVSHNLSELNHLVSVPWDLSFLGLSAVLSTVPHNCLGEDLHLLSNTHPALLSPWNRLLCLSSGN